MKTLTLSPGLAAVVSSVEIEPGGCVAHTPGDTYTEDSPAALVRTLSSVLYETAHNGRLRPLDVALRQLRDPALEEHLINGAPRLRREVSAPVVSDGVALLDGIRVHTPDTTHIDSEGLARFSIPAERPGLSPGFLYAFGSRYRKAPGPILRLYAHLSDPLAAPAVWSHALTELESWGLNWQGKVLSVRALYPRRDALVIYLHRDGWRLAATLSESLQQTGLLADGCSSFTQAITSGVACAFEPTDSRPTARGMSFGQHRAHVVASALVAHAVEAHSPTADDAVHEACIDADIDPASPARNLSSPLIPILGPI